MFYRDKMKFSTSVIFGRLKAKKEKGNLNGIHLKNQV